MDSFEGCTLFVEPPVVLAVTLLIESVFPKPDGEVGTLVFGGEWEYILLDLEPRNEDWGVGRHRLAILIHRLGFHPGIMELVFTAVRC